MIFNMIAQGGGGGGGSQSWELVYSTEITESTTSTTEASVGVFQLPASCWTSAKALFVRIRDKAGYRAGYFYGSDSYIYNVQEINASTTSITVHIARYIIRYSTANKFVMSLYNSTTGYGIYPSSLSSQGKLNVSRRYSSSNSLAIDGTYTIKVYALDFPDGISPFA